MDRLILFRHGKAEPDSFSGDDFDRRLQPRGQSEAAEMGERLAAQGVAVDLVLVSAAERTRETWDALAAAFPQAEVRFEDDLYLAESAAIRRIAEAAGADRKAVMVVGHNPGLHELTLRLMLEGGADPALFSKAQRNFPTAAVALFAIGPDGRPQAEDLLLPERWA
ncbi:SixA phosphatase family protein [Phenylobacterium deserti]|uniref:Histidine phosphatase family protein n=1 Tax=Phenylobacterium deserti TaxID=1914756 RepID=A0A328AS23_9CAUL|nr:histidine phosphatase family protein [Phenylobacterium deserti]RAK57852.1 histidine phosphatase family protein [Phenylobacterium deserti]